jgi:hypothetical protein
MGWPGRRNGARSKSVRTPLARTDELIIEEVDPEVLIYDERTHQAHCLAPAVAEVWRVCDGERSPEQLAAELEIDSDTVARALDELEACGLLDVGADSGVTRREATTRFAKIGAAGAAAPLIYSVVGPISAAAATVTPQFCAQFSGTNCGGNGTGCHSVAGCCCYHFDNGTSPAPLCSGNMQHCCLTPAFACDAGQPWAGHIHSSECGPNTTSPC